MPHIAKCHCGALSVEVPSLPEAAVRCNCTWCQRAGGRWAYYPVQEVRILSRGTDTVYAPNGFSQHHFCAACSGMVWNETPKWTEASKTDGRIPEERQISVNLNMIDEDAALALPVVEIDGRHQW